MLWVKTFHIVFMTSWFAGLFYLPRLFVYHAMATDDIGIERFKLMERKLFWGIMTPAAVLTAALGMWLLSANLEYYNAAIWMHVKLTLVALLIVYHIWCGKLMYDFRADQNQRSHTWYRWFNEVPVVLLIGIVALVVVRPWS